MGVSDVLEAFEELDDSKKQQALKQLQEQSATGEVFEIVELFKPEVHACPKCGSTDKYKQGKRAGRQRYSCKDCGKYYNELTNSPLENMRQPLKTFADFYEHLKNQSPLREIADDLNIALQTAFRWRHKVMEFFAKQHKNQTLSGIVEADETYLLHSKKGDKDLDREPRERGGESEYRGLSRDQDCILTLKDRSGNIVIELVGQARPSFDDIEPTLSECVTEDSVLCTDGMRAYGKFSREYGIERKNVKEVDEQSYHIQGINSLHHEIKEWLRDFRGIASKCINNYLGFYGYQHSLV